jgi:hypothetical protein
VSRCVLSEEEVVVGLLESEGVDEFVVLLKVVVAAEEQDYFVDVVFGGDGGTEGTHEAVTVLDQVAVYYALY